MHHHDLSFTIVQVQALHAVARQCMEMIKAKLPSRSLVMGAERCNLDDSGKCMWRIPKFHAMLHAASSLILYGPWSNVEAQVVEANHVHVKRLADLTNQRKGEWQLQILIRVARGEAAGKDWLHAEPGELRDGEEDHDVSQSALAQAESGPCATHVTLSKSNLVAGIRFNIWDFMLQWRMCRHRLMYPSQRKNSRSSGGIFIALPELVTVHNDPQALSEWIRYCADMKELPHFLGAYIQATYHHNIPEVQAPTDDAASFLSALEEHRYLLSLVQTHDAHYRCVSHCYGNDVLTYRFWCDNMCLRVLTLGCFLHNICRMSRQHEAASMTTYRAIVQKRRKQISSQSL